MQDPFLSQYRTTRNQPQNRGEMFKELDATELYCPTCACATPVRKRLLLVLPEGDKYEYLCGYCMTSVGTKMVHKNAAAETRILA